MPPIKKKVKISKVAMSNLCSTDSDESTLGEALKSRLPPELHEIADKVEEFEKWIGALSVIEQLNFKALISFPNAADVIARCPDPTYRDMAIFALALRTQAMQNPTEEK